MRPSPILKIFVSKLATWEHQPKDQNQYAPATLDVLVAGSLPKGDALAVARVAGILAAKQTASWIPLCHPLPIDHVAITLTPDPELPGVRAEAEIVVTARTGAEMEALCAVTGALLALYDMAKAMDREMTIERVQLEAKSGGRRGTYLRGLVWAAGIVALSATVAACEARPTRRYSTPADSAAAAQAMVADTQVVVDSAGNELELIIGRPLDPGQREVIPRRGAADPDAPAAVRALAPRQAHALMQGAVPAWYVIDVRGDEEYVREGRLPGALLVELPQLERNMADLHVRSDQTILVYADAGPRAERGARLLAGYGFPTVRVLEGGFAAWRQAGLPVEGAR
ncbi:MAG: cyclic pyranopterin monophosphate synthase MoaC [Gemmatimonadota bacterium]